MAQQVPSRWDELCSRLRLLEKVSNEVQEAEQADLLDYLRVWKVLDARYIRERWVYHPNEAVKRQLEYQFRKYVFIYDLLFDDVYQCLEDLYHKVKRYELRNAVWIKTIDEAEKLFLVFEEFSRYRRYVKRLVNPEFRFN